MGFKDYFSKQSGGYARFRPKYPQELYDFVLAYTRGRDLAWDCATGSGQAALVLSKHFEKVIASDASEAQLLNAKKAANVEYVLAPAEKTPVPDHSVNLITVAQALHWFHFEEFYAETRRAAKPGALLAAWCYELHTISDAVDSVMNRFYHDIVGPYWPKERVYVEQKYRTIPFPFRDIPAPQFRFQLNWNLEELVGYLNTWSSTQRYLDEHGKNPIELISDDLVRAWGDPGEVKPVTWPLNLRVGVVE